MNFRILCANEIAIMQNIPTSQFLFYVFHFFFFCFIAHRIIDAMEECALSAQAGNSCENALQASVECIVALLESLQTLCSGNIDENSMCDQTVQSINNRFASLKDVDYTGPLTYQYMARLPAPYRYVSFLMFQLFLL